MVGLSVTALLALLLFVRHTLDAPESSTTVVGIDHTFDGFTTDVDVVVFFKNIIDSIRLIIVGQGPTERERRRVEIAHVIPRALVALHDINFRDEELGREDIPLSEIAVENRQSVFGPSPDSPEKIRRIVCRCSAAQRENENPGKQQ